MLSSKQALDAVLVNNSDFEVAHDGDKSSPDTPFIRLKYRPSDREVYAMNGTPRGKIKEVVKLDIFAYDITVNKCIELHQKVIELIECKEFGNVKVGIGVPDGLGYQNLGNDIFEGLITFDVIQYN